MTPESAGDRMDMSAGTIEYEDTRRAGAGYPSVHQRHTMRFRLLAWLRRTSAIVAGLLAGAGLGVSLLEAALDGSASFYMEYKQLVIRAYAVPLPLLGVGGIVASVAILYLGRHDRMIMWFTSTAILSLVVGLSSRWAFTSRSTNRSLTGRPSGLRPAGKRSVIGGGTPTSSGARRQSSGSCSWWSPW